MLESEPGWAGRASSFDINYKAARINILLISQSPVQVKAARKIDPRMQDPVLT